MRRGDRAGRLVENAGWSRLSCGGVRVHPLKWVAKTDRQKPTVRAEADALG